MPAESAKNRMAFQKPDPTTGKLLYTSTIQTLPTTGKLLYTSTIQTLTSVAAKEGVLKLWTGFAPYYIRCGGHTVAMFVSMEYIRALL